MSAQFATIDSISISAAAGRQQSWEFSTDF